MADEPQEVRSANPSQLPADDGSLRDEVVPPPVHLVQWITLFIVGGYVVQSWVEGYSVARTVNLSTVALIVYSMWTYRRRENFFLACQTVLFAIWFCVSLSPLSDGMSESKGLFLIPIVPCLAAYLLGAKAGLRWAVCSAFSIVVVIGCDAIWDLPVEYSATDEVDWLIRRVMGIFVFAVMASFQARQARGHLWHAVLQSEELTRANEAAQAASRAKGAFLTRVSHEIRTPMHGLVGMTQALAERDLCEEDRRCVLAIERCADSLQSLLNDGLELSDVESGQVRVERVRFGLAQIVQDIAMLFSAKAKISETPLETCLPPTEVYAWGDPKRTRQVLSNLVGNAIKFGAGKPVRISLETVTGAGGQEQVEIAVQDHGVGISKENQASLFAAYEQLEEGRHSKVAGTGLGLTISRDLAELMEGEIGVQSQVGEGSVFTLRLDRAPHDEQLRTLPVRESGAFSEPSPRSFYAQELLVVDDNAINRRVACAMLRAWGARVHQAKDGEEACTLAQSQRFSLILMDLQMPVMDGFEATRAIRAHGLNRNTPIVALTANAFAQDRARCFEAGMNEHLAKPFKKAQLFAVCAEQLRTNPSSSLAA